MRTVALRRLNNDLSLQFFAAYTYRYTPDDGRRALCPKHCTKSIKDQRYLKQPEYKKRKQGLGWIGERQHLLKAANIGTCGDL